MPQNRRHRKKVTILVDGRPIEVPAAPSGLSAARQESWAAYWQSPQGAASASDINHVDAVFRLWGQYREYDRVTDELAKRPIMSPGSMGQERVSPLAPRQSELLRRIEAGERKAGIGGVLNQRRLPGVEVAPDVILENMLQAVIDGQVANPRWDDPLHDEYRTDFGHKPKDRERLAIAISRATLTAEELAYWNAELALIDARIGLHDSGELVALAALDEATGCALGRGPSAWRAAIGVHEPEPNGWQPLHPAS